MAELPMDVMKKIVDKDLMLNYPVFKTKIFKNTLTWKKQSVLMSILVEINKWLLVSRSFTYLKDNEQMRVIYEIAWGKTNNYDGKNKKSKVKGTLSNKSKVNWWLKCEKQSMLPLSLKSSNNKFKHMKQGVSKNDNHKIRLEKIQKIILRNINSNREKNSENINNNEMIST
jgi:hypothetical protein